VSARSLTQIAWHFAAELEALFGGPGRPLRWRRRELTDLRATFGRSLSIRRHFDVARRGGLVLGERAAFGDYTQLANYARIEIGDDFLSAGNLIINTGSHDPRTLTPSAAPVKIGHRVWCGIGVTILAGVTIGDDVVIGAGAVVTADIPSNSVAAGVPAKVLRPLDRSGVERLWSWSMPQEPAREKTNS
jgi:maltose O-acetyltransferase